MFFWGPIKRFFLNFLRVLIRVCGFGSAFPAWWVPCQIAAALCVWLGAPVAAEDVVLPAAHHEDTGHPGLHRQLHQQGKKLPDALEPGGEGGGMSAHCDEFSLWLRGDCIPMTCHLWKGDV